MAELPKLEPCTSFAEGDPGYSDGVKVYVISKGKMEREGLKVPADKKDKEEFFKKHADHELPMDKDMPVITVDVASATEKK